VVMKFLMKVARTCSLTRRMKTSQLQSLKFGQSKKCQEKIRFNMPGTNEYSERNREKDKKNEKRENKERAQTHKEAVHMIVLII
jgi:hypothetical protein